MICLSGEQIEIHQIYLHLHQVSLISGQDSSAELRHLPIHLIVYN